MMENKRTRSQWFREEKLLVTELSGDITIVDIEKWETSLYGAFDEIEDGGTFKIFVDLVGLKAVNIDAHKRYRDIIPLALADYGWRVGYLDLFEEAAGLKLTNKRGVSCIGAAHAHQDATKIEKYQSMFGTDREQFFTDPVRAREWIEQL